MAKAPVGSFPAGRSFYGCDDMAGNAWEWVSDNYVKGGIARGILRGGGYRYGALQARSSYQGFEDLETTCNDVGLRPASNVAPGW